MEILQRDEYKDLLRYLTYVKMAVSEWLFVKVRRDKNTPCPITVENIAEGVHGLFKNREGKLYIESDDELLMIIHWGERVPVSIVADDVGRALPGEGFEISVHEATKEGVTKLEIEISYKKPETKLTYSQIRERRWTNVVLIADDDMYMRSLVVSGIGKEFKTLEVADGGDVVEVYKQEVPDVLFLDIHLPTLDGASILHRIKTIDPAAYVIMLSADSSPENVRHSMHEGAKGFLTKPFTKEKLLAYLHKCPTIKKPS